MPDATSLNHGLKNKQLKVNADPAKGVFQYYATSPFSFTIKLFLCY